MNAVQPAARLAWRALAVLLIGGGLWLAPVPEGLDPRAWRLFAIFSAAILGVILDVQPVLTLAILAAALGVLTSTLEPAEAWSGFANGTVLLIVAAFLLARGVVNSGLGNRVALWVVARAGGSLLGLGYSVLLVDALLGPTVPSNTARSGILYPLVGSTCEVIAGAARAPVPRTRAYLMFCGIASLALSSALWFTAMAANPVGAGIAAGFGVRVDFAGWLLAASVPTLLAMAATPPVLLRWFAPELRRTLEVQSHARSALAALGPLARAERIALATLALLLAGWASGGWTGLDATALAWLGLAVLLASRVIRVEDLAREGEVLAIFIWFAVLLGLSMQLERLGFMGWAGNALAVPLEGLAWPLVYVLLLLVYVLLHYLFVSQTAHLLALMGIFMAIGTRCGVPAELLAWQLLFATNYFSPLTPQASSANLLFIGSGALAHAELYRVGGLSTLFYLAIYLVPGTAWLLLLV